MKAPGQTGPGRRASLEQPPELDELLNRLPVMAYCRANDRNGTVVFVSAGSKSLTGYSADSITADGLAWATLVHEADREAVKKTLESSLAAGEAFDLQYRIVDKSGQVKWVRDQGHGIADDDGQIQLVEGYLDDITPLQQAMLKEQLAHADRLNMLGEMAAGIAHEINQPLAAISLFAQTGQRLVDAADYESLGEVFDKLSRHSRRAGAIVERIQNMSRRQASVRQTVDLNKLIEDVVELAEIDARTGNISIEFRAASKLPAVKVDVVQIQQVALNLVRNSIDAMQSVDCRNGDKIRVSTAMRDKRFVEVVVSDRGGGVPDDVAGRLFESFLTTKNSGLGVGLPISRAIVSAHGGQLEFRNNEVGGATFSFTLPVDGGEGG